MPVRPRRALAFAQNRPKKHTDDIETQEKPTVLSAQEMEEKISFMEDIYLKVDIAECVDEINDYFNRRPKGVLKDDVQPQDKLKPSTKAVLDEALVWLKQGQNLCFYGFGNKEYLVDDFIKANFSEDHLIINIRGYQRNLTPRSLLMQILQIFETDELELQRVKINDKSFKPEDVIHKCMQNIKTLKKNNLEKLMAYFSTMLSVIKTPIIFVVHNLDNTNMRMDDFLTYFSSLAVNKPNIYVNAKININFVATVDSIKTYYYFNTKILENFSFMFFELTSPVIYDKQFDYMSVTDVIQTGRKYLQNINGIIESLTENQKELVLFVLHEFKSKEKKAIEENELFKRAVEEAKVSSLYQFKDNIREAVQHHIFSTKYMYNQFYYTTKLTNNEMMDILDNNGFKEEDHSIEYQE